MRLLLKGIPNPRQAEFFRSQARHTAYGGARGGGKSWAMRRKLVLLALHAPGLNLLLLRRTLPELRENHLVPLLAELGGVAVYNGTERVFRFPPEAGCGWAIAIKRRTYINTRARNMM